MCQSAVFMIEDGEEKEIKRDVILVEPVENGVKIQGFFESPMILPAHIARIDLLKHKILLKPLKQDKC